MATTLAQLIAGARELADMQEDDDFVSDATWLSWVNQGIKELHGLVVSAYQDSYFTSVDFTLDDSSNVYTLPSDFHSIRGLTLNPDQSNRATVHKFNFGDRNQDVGGGLDLFTTSTRERRYRVVSRTQLIIEPKERAAGTYRLYYVPRPLLMAEPVEVVAAIDASDSNAANAIPPGPGSFFFANLTFPADVPTDESATVTTAFLAPNTGANDVWYINGLAPANPNGISVTVAVPTITGPASGTVTLNYQPVGTADELDDALDIWAEYVMVVTAIKALGKEESSTNELLERRNVIRADIAGSVGNDANEPDSITDVQGW